MPLVEHWDDYEMPPKTMYVDGDKRFGDVVAGDSIFFYDRVCNTFTKYEVKKGLHEKEINGKRRLVISLKDLKDARKCFYIDFGSMNCGNVLRDTKDMSIVFQHWGNYGTCAKSVIADRKKHILDKLAKVQAEVDAEIAEIEKYEKMV